MSAGGGGCSSGECAEGAGCAGGVGLCDAVLLSPLTEDTFLQNLQMRYKRDVIYTYVGNAVVSVNPCRPLPLYSAELARTYLVRPPYTLPPHIYAVAATAYRRVRDRGDAQCIVVTGESGAGKTEAARVCLQCCVVAGAGEVRAGEGRVGEGRAGRALTAAGTLLEAFGNAATTRNHNASRFGKLLDIELDFTGQIVGGHITHYLLEKGRAGRVPDGERNFHVFYQLLAGADSHTLKCLRLQRAADSYRLLRGTSPAGSPRRTPPPRAADAEHLAFTTSAMCALGVQPAARAAVLRLLAFLLKLGNVDFQPAHNIDGSIGARATNEYEAAEACALVGVSTTGLLRALGVTHSRALAPSRGSESPESEMSEAESSACSEESVAGAEAGAGWAAAARDQLVAAVYARLFTWLINTVNDAIKPASLESRRSLGILDVYGFENLSHNTLEQLVINYAAERVQCAVVHATLAVPRELAAVEGLQAAPGVAGATSVVAQGAEPVLTALRGCAARGAGDASLLTELSHLHSARVLALPPHHFQVLHFAGAVTYCVRGITAADRDTLPPRAAPVLHAAGEPLLASLFPDGGRGGSPRRGGSLAGRQRALVAAVGRRLAGLGAGLRLVRCVRADASARPRHFDGHLVRHQIRTQSIVEMAVVRRSGWCECICARALLVRYGVLWRAGNGTVASDEGGEDAMRQARALLASLPIPSAEFTFGLTKVFIRSPRTVWELEAWRAARVNTLVGVAQRAWRRHRAGRRGRAALVLQRAWRARITVGVSGAGVTWRAVIVLQHQYVQWMRRRYLSRLWTRLPARHLSPLCVAWPPVPVPRLLSHTDTLLRHIHHRWRCYKYRLGFDQTARNRMREKVTASILFKDRKQNYARSVGHPFVGDYVRLRASQAWRRRCAAGGGGDGYVVFADVVCKVGRSGRGGATLLVLSTAALLLLEPRSLRVKRRVAAAQVARLSLSPGADDVLVVHVLEPEPASCGAGGPLEPPGCILSGSGGGRGDLVLRACHVLELATKLFLVVQHAAGRAPGVTVAAQFEADLGQPVTVTFHSTGAPAQTPRLVRRGSRLDVLL